MSCDPSAQWLYLAWSISHVVDILGWHQHAVLRRHGLNPLHMSLLLRADRHGAVTFDDIRRDTQMPIHSISRAANWLDNERDLGTVVFVKSDRRRRRFRINKAGRDLLRTIELETAKALLVDLGAVWADGQVFEESKRYYTFARFLWDVTRLLPDTGCAHPWCYLAGGMDQREIVPAEERAYFQQAYDTLRRRAEHQNKSASG